MSYILWILAGFLFSVAVCEDFWRLLLCLVALVIYSLGLFLSIRKDLQ
jgi:hypothetical protein